MVWRSCRAFIAKEMGGGRFLLWDSRVLEVSAGLLALILPLVISLKVSFDFVFMLNEQTATNIIGNSG